MKRRSFLAMLGLAPVAAAPAVASANERAARHKIAEAYEATKGEWGRSVFVVEDNGAVRAMASRLDQLAISVADQ